MDYTPKQAEQKVPAPAYALVKDVTGKPAPKRGVQTLPDSKGRVFKVPYPPKSNCKKCNGRGFVGLDVKTQEVVVCKKCFPMM